MNSAAATAAVPTAAAAKSETTKMEASSPSPANSTLEANLGAISRLRVIALRNSRVRSSLSALEEVSGMIVDRHHVQFGIVAQDQPKKISRYSYSTTAALTG